MTSYEFRPLGHSRSYTLNTAPSEEERLEEIKQAYIDGIVDVRQMEEDVQFVLEGGYFSGSYAKLRSRDVITEIGR